MEAASYRQFLTFKMHYLEEQMKQIHTLVDKKMEKVLQRSKASLEEEDTGRTLKEINGLLEDMALFVTQKCAEMNSVGEDSMNAEASSDITKQNSGSLSGSREEMGRKTMSFQEMEECIKQLTEKQSKTEMEQNTRLEAIENQLQTVSNKQLESESHHQLVVEELEEQKKEKKKTETTFQELKKEMETVHLDFKKLCSNIDYVASCCNYDKQVEAFEERIKKLEAVVPRFQQLEALQEAVRNLEGIRKDCKSEMAESNIVKVRTLECKLEAVEQEVKELQPAKTKVQKLEQKLERQETLASTQSHKIEELDIAMKELAKSTEANTDSLRICSSKQERDSEKLHEIQNKLNQIKKSSQVTTDSLEKKFDSVELKYKMVCQIIADRLAPLERLRDIFNKKIKYRDENIKKLNDVASQVLTLVPKVALLENTCRKPAVGFSAAFASVQRPVKDEIIRHFTNVTSNIGNSFDPSTGIFTAPVDGMYGVCLTMWQWHDGIVTLNIKKASGNPTCPVEELIGFADTVNDNTGGCGFAITELKANDRLYCIFQSFEKRPRLSGGTSFSCFLID